MKAKYQFCIEVIIEGDTEQEIQETFDALNHDDLQNELQEKNIVDYQFLEVLEIDTTDKDDPKPKDWCYRDINTFGVEESEDKYSIEHPATDWIKSYKWG